MNLVEAVRLYIRRITKEVPGMKALLLDKETTRIISSIYTVSELLTEEIYLVDLIENKREKIGKLKVFDCSYIGYSVCETSSFFNRVHQSRVQRSTI